MENVAVDHWTTCTRCCRWTGSGQELIAVPENDDFGVEIPRAIYFVDICLHDHPEHSIGPEAVMADWMNASSLCRGATQGQHF